MGGLRQATGICSIQSAFIFTSSARIFHPRHSSGYAESVNNPPGALATDDSPGSDSLLLR